jgi:N-acetylneuraminic acid mutarotase
MATCTQHHVETNLSCRTCGTPVCPDCAVRTVMGVSCATHAGKEKEAAAVAVAPKAERSSAGGHRLLIGGVVTALLVAAVVFLRPGGDGGTAGDRGWTALPSSGLTARSDFSSVTTGRSLLVWGGNSPAGPLNDGAVFDTVTSAWKPISASPLSIRRGHTAVWTGTQMIVFGGVTRGDACRPSCALNDGATYDPVADTWKPIAPAPIPGRSGHSAVYFQNRMVVWGGAVEGGKPTADGASYDPMTDAWTVLPPAPLKPRVQFRTVAASNRMLVWGGSDGGGQTGTYFDDGAIYSPATNAWSPMAAFPKTNEGGGRDNFSSVWTGEKMLVWGGYTRNTTCNPCTHEDGAAYDLKSDSWALMSPSPIDGRGAHRAVWTGREMVVWGGFTTTEVNDGARYNPASDTWVPLSPSPLGIRQGPGMVWAGDRAVIWGGVAPGARGGEPNPYYDDGALLRLGS